MQATPAPTMLDFMLYTSKSTSYKDTTRDRWAGTSETRVPEGDLVPLIYL